MNYDYITGDAIEVMSGFRDNQFDATVTSPPYNIGIDYKSFKDNLNVEEYSEFTRNWIDEALRVSSVVVVNFGAPTSKTENLGRFICDVSSVGCIQSHIVWAKSISTEEWSIGHYKPVNSKRYLNSVHESVFVVSRNGDKPLGRKSVGVPYADKTNISRFSGGGEDLRCRGNIWYLPYKTRTKKIDHPATYPVELAEMMIKISNAENDILDPFCGIGTTMLAAQNLGMRSTGIDIEKWIEKDFR